MPEAPAAAAAEPAPPLPSALLLRVTAAVEVMMVDGCLDVIEAIDATVTGVGCIIVGKDLVPRRGRLLDEDDEDEVLRTAVAVDL